MMPKRSPQILTSARPGILALTRLLPMLAAFLPALLLGWLVSENAVNMPIWDDWERGPLIEKFKNGTLTIKDLYAPHIDHRIFFPRLVILALNEVSGGDLRWEVAFIFATGFLAALGVAKLAQATIFEGGGRTPWGVVLVANLIILSPLQWDNWIWGIQIAFMLPMTCLIWSLVTVLQPWAWWKRLLVCLLLATVGTHSFGHGFAVWPAVFGLVLLRRDLVASIKERLLFLGIWGFAGTFTLLCYTQLDFHNTSHQSHSYGQLPGEPPPGVVNFPSVLEGLGDAAHFMKILAGNPFSRLHLVNPLKMAPVVGSVIIGLFALLGLWAVREGWLKRKTWDAALPWLALGCASLLGMIAITVGRLYVTHINRATSIRYISISQYLAVAVLFLLVVWWTRSRPRWTIGWRTPVGAVALAVLAGYCIPLWNYGAQMMRLCGQARLQAKAALMFINHWPPDQYGRIDANMDFARIQAKTLNKHGLLNPPLVSSLELDQFKPKHEGRGHSTARLESLETLGNGSYLLKGYTRFSDRPADGVLLTWERPGGKAMIFGLAEPTLEMIAQPYPDELELTGRVRADYLDYCRWQERLHIDHMGFAQHPELKQVVVRAWAFDVKKQRAYRIRGSWQFNRDGTFEVLDPS